MLNASDKPKRKQSPHVHRRLHLLLLVWIIVTFLAAWYPPIWLMPPYVQLTPYVYIVTSLGWIPFALRHIRRHSWHWLTIILIAGCLIGTRSLVFNQYFPDKFPQCNTGADDHLAYYCGNWCQGWGIGIEGISNLPVGYMAFASIGGWCGPLF